MLELKDKEKEESTELTVIEQTKKVKPTKLKKRGKAKRGEKTEQSQDSFSNFDPFIEFAKILNTTQQAIKEEAVFALICKVTSRLEKVVVRYDVSNAELEKIILNANALNLGGLSVAPIYLSMCAKQVKKHSLDRISVGSVIDFPFGESSFRGKMSNVKESLKFGADKFTVTLPSMLFLEDNAKELKKQVKKLGKIYSENAGIAVNATDLVEEKIKRAMKAVNKSKVGFITFAFSSATLDEVRNKLTFINKYKSGKKVCVLANVDSIEGVSELLKLNVDFILTPFADDIGKELVEKFNIKSVKLY